MTCAVLVACLAAMNAITGAEAAGSKGPSSPVPVLVELFTSEGCSSCPPADRLLRELSASPPSAAVTIVPLSIHVDYWNDLGWTDALSSNAFTRRQQEYAAAFGAQQVYTPQMIMDGRAEFVGSDAAKARAAIAKAATALKGTLTVSRSADGVLTIEIRNAPVQVRKGVADVLLAIAEDTVTTDVKRGENAGRTLTHTAVARSLRSVGIMSASEESATIRATLENAETSTASARSMVVFVQERSTKRILAIGKSPF